MKHFLLIACILIGSFSVANAGNGLTQRANDSAINAGKIALNAKIAQLQAAYAANPASAASVQKTSEVRQLLVTGMEQTMHAVNLEPNKTTQKTINSRYMNLEQANHLFIKASSNPAQNHAELLRQAQAFYSNY